MRVYVVRHGQTDWNVEHRAQGHTDTPLNALGLAQAASLRDAFGGVEVSEILSSDLQRARETAHPIAEVTGAPIQERRDLRERGFGDFEGRRFDEVTARLIAEAERQGIEREFARPPNGESFDDVWHRLDPVAQAVAVANNPVAVVTHGGTGALLISKLMGLRVVDARGFRLDNASVTILEPRFDGHFRLLGLSDISHYRDLALA